MIKKQRIKNKSKFNLLFIASIIITFSSCNQSYKSLFKENTNNYNILKKDISDKVKKSNPNNPESNTDNFDLFINQIVSKENNIGVYNYGIVGSHHSRKNIFTYDKNAIHIINASSIDSAIKEIQSFLIDQKFTEKQQKQCVETITKLLTENTSDSF